ncbi:MAG: hypothetical protein ABIR68_13990 [Ilumatobacteraceae bacterium]
MTVQMWFVEGDVEIAPGTTTVLQLIVVNSGEETETFRLTVAGLAAPWTTLQPPIITVLAGSQAEIGVAILPPRLPSTAAGATVMTLRAIAQDRADVAAETTIAITVAPVHDRRLTLLQPAQRTRRWATFEMTLENRGNTHASCRMRLLDPSGRLEADFDPPSVGVDPGATSLVRARVRANGRQWQRRSRTLAFRVEAEQQGTAAAIADGTLVQVPVVPERLLGRVIATLLVAAVLVAGWFGVIKPAIRDAADDAVRDRLPAAPASVTTTVQTVDPVPTLDPTDPTATTLPPTSDGLSPVDTTPPTGATTPTTTVPGATTTVAAAAAGSTVAERLSVEVPPGQTLTTNYVVPAGSVFRLTDVWLQNPNFDVGTATLLRGDQALNTWLLSTTAFAPVALVTPVEVPAGGQLVFSVTCVSVGTTAAPSGACSAALFISGRLVPA